MGEERETAGRSEVGLPRFYSNNLQNFMFLIIFLLYLAHFQMIVYILLFGTGFYYGRCELRVPQIVAYEY